jgi:hypothetical protein
MIRWSTAASLFLDHALMRVASFLASAGTSFGKARYDGACIRPQALVA